jgi:hypothetical protein
MLISTTLSFNIASIPHLHPQLQTLIDCKLYLRFGTLVLSLCRMSRFYFWTVLTWLCRRWRCCSFCNITYYVMTNPLRRRRRCSHWTQGYSVTDEWLFFILLLSHTFWYAIRINELIRYLSNDREHVARCQGISSVPKNPTLPFLHVQVYNYLAIDPHPSKPSPPPTNSLVVCALRRMACHVHSWCYARHKRLNLWITAHSSKGIPCMSNNNNNECFVIDRRS